MRQLQYVHVNKNLFGFYPRIIVCVAVGILVFPHMHARGGTGKPDKIEDHLLSVDFEVDEDVRAVHTKKLFITPANCGRVLIQPPFEPEVAASVYSIDKRFNVTLTKAARNLSQAIIDGRPTRNITITRIDADISESAAMAVRCAWEKMLANTRPYDEVHYGETLDAEAFEFSLIAGTKKQYYGEAPDKRGRLVKKLIALGKLLVSYCETSQSERPRVAREIETDANQLIANIKAQERRQ